MVTDGDNHETRNLVLAAIAAGFTTFAFSLGILMGMGYGIETTIPIAYALSSFAFGLFLCRLYRRMSKKPTSVVMPTPGTAFEETKEQKCLILAARTHGALQDRANYWLSGKYGIVKSSAVSATEKGIFMTIFYEVTASPETPAIDVNDITPELPAVNNLAPLRNF